jgi:EpsI family protein
LRTGVRSFDAAPVRRALALSDFSASALSGTPVTPAGHGAGDVMKSKSRRILTMASLLLAGLAYRSLVSWDPGQEVNPIDESWFFRPSETSPRVIFLLAMAMLWRKWPALREASRHPASPGAALVPLFAAIALYLWGHHANAPDLILASGVALALAASLLWAGAHLARALTFPLLVLLFAIPIPAALANALFYALQGWTARDAAFLLSLTGMPLVREGNAIYGVHEQFMVIDTCAGLRFIEVLTLLAVLYAGWFRAGRLRTLLRVALAVPIAYVFNLLRVCVLITNPTSEISSMHSVQGWAVFLAAVLCLAIVDRTLLGRLPARAPAAADRSAPGGALCIRDRSSRSWPLAVPLVLAAFAAVSIWLPRWQIPPESRFVPIDLPMEIDGWRMERSLPLDRPYLGIVQYSTHQYRPYRRDTEVIFLFLASDDRTERGRSFLSRKNAFVDGGWKVEERRRVALGPSAQRVESILARSRERRVLSFSWYERTGSVFNETLRALLAADQSSLRRPKPGRVTRISTPVTPEPGGREAAEARLRAFAASLEVALRDTRAFGVAPTVDSQVKPSREFNAPNPK